MTNVNPKLYENVSLVGIIDPAAIVASTVVSGWISAKIAHSYMALISSGTLGASATLDAKLEQATDDSGSGAKDITGKAITQFVKATNDDDQAAISIKQSDLDVANDFTHFRVSMTIGAATSDAAAYVFAADFRNGPGTDNDLASVVESV